MTPSPEGRAGRPTEEEVFLRIADVGRVTWHCSEEDGLPDVGLSLGLGNGKSLWVGEITRERHEEAGGSDLSSDGGWWIILYGSAPSDTIVIGKCLSSETASELIDSLEISLAQADAAIKLAGGDDA